MDAVNSNHRGNNSKSTPMAQERKDTKNGKQKTIPMHETRTPRILFTGRTSVDAKSEKQARRE